MARMSIDDKFLRDSRVKLLGNRLGWSRRETMGCLLDVFAIAYDREDDVLPVAEIDEAAGKQCFAVLLVEVDLGELVGDRVRIKGAGERIEYLEKKREAGRIGGRKSGESRRNQREAKRSTASTTPCEANEASWNPPDPVPDLVPDQKIRDLTPPRDPAVQSTTPVHVNGDDQRPSIADRQTVREMLRANLEAARKRLATAKRVAYRPLLAQDPGIDRDLAGALALCPDRAALELLTEQCQHAIAMAELEVKSGNGEFKWFTGAIFAEKNLRRLAAMNPDEATKERKPPKSATVGRVEPKHHTEYPDGDQAL